MPRPLAPDVARGAANVAAARRLRNMVHGAVALEPESPDGSQRGPEEHVQHYKRRHTAQAQAAQQSRGYRHVSSPVLPSCSAIHTLPRLCLLSVAGTAIRCITVLDFMCYNTVSLHILWYTL